MAWYLEVKLAYRLFSVDESRVEETSETYLELGLDYAWLITRVDIQVSRSSLNEANSIDPEDIFNN